MTGMAVEVGVGTITVKVMVVMETMATMATMVIIAD